MVNYLKITMTKAATPITPTIRLKVLITTVISFSSSSKPIAAPSVITAKTPERPGPEPVRTRAQRCLWK